MSRKHHTKHNRTPSSYPRKVRMQGGGGRMMHDYVGVGKLHVTKPDRTKGKSQ